MADFRWTEPAKTDMRKWYVLDGWSASQIAKELSRKYGQAVSRSAVIGKLHREGVSAEVRQARASAPRAVKSAPVREKPVRITRPTVPKAPAPAPIAKTAPVAEPVAAVLARQPSTAPKPPPPPELVVVGQAVVLAGLKACQCKYPVGPEPKIGDMDQQLFCAAPTGDATLVYCPDHAAIAWKPSTAAEKAKRLKNDIGAAHRDMLARNSRRHTSGTRAVF